MRAAAGGKSRPCHSACRAASHSSCRAGPGTAQISDRVSVAGTAGRDRGSRPASVLPVAPLTLPGRAPSPGRVPADGRQALSTLRFESIPIRDRGEPLVDLGGYPFDLDPVYADRGWSADPRLYLRRNVADRLARVQESWRGRYRFRIWDAYRPRAVQQAIYAAYERTLAQANPQWDAARLREETQRFVTRATDPARIPPHATGGAVDLTLLDAAGTELDMGTAFDHFGPEAAPDHHEPPHGDPVVRANRRRLIRALADAGFTVDETEWWHFDCGNQSWALRRRAGSARYGKAAVVPAGAPARVLAGTPVAGTR